MARAIAAGRVPHPRHRRGPGQRRPQQRPGRAVRPDPPRRATGTLGRHHRPAGRRSGGGPDRRLCRAGSAGGPATGSRTGDGNFAAATAIIGGHIVVHGARSILLRRRMPGLRGLGGHLVDRATATSCRVSAGASHRATSRGRMANRRGRRCSTAYAQPGSRSCGGAADPDPA
jgi:hypothetical protein